MSNNTNLSETQIVVNVMYYLDDNGNKIYDYEEMLREFELKMSELDTEQYSKTSR